MYVLVEKHQASNDARSCDVEVNRRRWEPNERLARVEVPPASITYKSNRTNQDALERTSKQQSSVQILYQKVHGIEMLSCLTAAEGC